MSKFINELDMKRPVGASGYFVLDNDFIFESKYGYRITCKKGFHTDGNSTPWWLWWFAPPFVLDAESAVIHDGLYEYKLLPKEVCDNIFRECVQTRKLPWYRSALKYLAVAIGGDLAFKSDSKFGHTNIGKVIIERIDSEGNITNISTDS